MISNAGWMAICVLIYIIKYVFLVPIEDKRLYAIYKVRDEVALAAMRGEISQESKEYVMVMSELNFDLYYMKHDYDFGIFLRNLFVDPLGTEKNFDKMCKMINKYEVLKNARIVSKNYFIQSLKIRLFFLNLIVIIPLYIALSAAVWILELIQELTMVSKTLMKVTVRKKALRSIRTEYQSSFLKRVI